MANILGPIRFQIGQHNSWTGIPDGDELEELRMGLREGVYREFGSIPGLEWKLWDHRRLSSISKKITPTGELPHDVLIDFIQKQLVIINRHRSSLGKPALRIEHDDKAGIGCCFSNGTGWEPNLVRPLYVGPEGERRPFLLEVTAPSTGRMVKCEMLVQLLWECEMTDANDKVRLELERVWRALAKNERRDLLKHAKGLLPEGAKV